MDVGVERTFSPQNFSMFPCEQVDDLRATKSECVGLIVRVVTKIFNLCGHDPTTSQTDDMRSQDHALHYSASRGKNLGQICCGFVVQIRAMYSF